MLLPAPHSSYHRPSEVSLTTAELRESRLSLNGASPEAALGLPRPTNAQPPPRTPPPLPPVLQHPPAPRPPGPLPLRTAGGAGRSPSVRTGASFRRQRPRRGCARGGDTARGDPGSAGLKRRTGQGGGPGRAGPHRTAPRRNGKGNAEPGVDGRR